MRLPRPLFHHGLGRLLGHTFLLITHQGRKTGKPHETVAMALSWDTASRKLVVCSAWGETQWLRNLRANPALQIQIGSDRFVPAHRFLSEDEAVAAATEFGRQHPWRLRLFGTILGWGDLSSEPAIRNLIHDRPFVAFWPADSDSRASW